MGNSILIAEKDKTRRRVLSRHFSLAGFTVYPAESCPAALKAAEKRRPDCFLLDSRLPEGGAGRICRYVRDSEIMANNPIFILTGNSGQFRNDEDLCLADVFIERDGSIRDIPSLIKKRLRQAEWKGGLLNKQDLILDSRTRAVMRNGKVMARLSNEQFRFVSLLMERSPGFVTGSEICSKIFARMPANEQEAISALVYRLRKQLGPQLARRIRNKRFKGWVYLQPRLRETNPSPKPASLQVPS